MSEGKASAQNTSSDTSSGNTIGGRMRLRLVNIPSMFGVSQVRKFVADSLGIPQASIVCRKAPKWSHALLSFRPADRLTTLPDLEQFRAKLDGIQWKKAKLGAKLEEAREDPVLLAQRSKESSALVKTLSDQVTPLWNVPYEEQLRRKEEKFATLLRQKFPFTDWTMEAIKASPITKGYRNKCEFTIGLNEGGEPTVGFLLGGYREGIVTVANAEDTLHVPAVLKQLANHLQSHIRSSSLNIYNRTSKEGFWRLMLARVHDDNVMVAIQVTAPATAEAIDKLVEHMKTFDYNGVNPIKSFLTQETTAVHHGMDTKAAFILRFGEETITQSLSTGLKFSISPLSFFQVNISATEILYATVGEYVRDSSSQQSSVLLDLCCGTGTIGMTLAKSVSKVIGVELVEDAVADAKKNATDNCIENITFICDRVENAMEKTIASIPADQPTVVVLDPPRNGVHVSVIKAIRKCPRISRVVFVACNPEASLANFVDLTREETKGMVGSPFKLKKAVAVDLFPHTEHCELILQFDR